MVKRLAEINLINRDEEAAMKYLRILSKQNFTVNGLKTESPEKRLRQTMVKKKGHLFLKQIRYVPPQPMWSNPLLLASNPENEMARDYLLCLHLLAKTCLLLMTRNNRESPKRLYAEALMIDLVRHHASGKEIQETIVDPTVVQDFKEYTRLHRQSKEPHKH